MVRTYEIKAQGFMGFAAGNVFSGNRAARPVFGQLVVIDLRGGGPRLSRS